MYSINIRIPPRMAKFFAFVMFFTMFVLGYILFAIPRPQNPVVIVRKTVCANGECKPIGSVRATARQTD